MGFKTTFKAGYVKRILPVLQTEGKSTLTQAIQRAGLAGITHGCLAICRERSYCVINRAQVTDFLNRGSFEYLFDLLDVPCHCNNKCGILTNCVLSPLHFVALDKGHWGMHLLCDTLPALGLHLIGGFHICEKTWQPVNFQVTFKKLAPKAFAKILHRVALFSSPSHSIVKKSIAHSSFIQSCRITLVHILGSMNKMSVNFDKCSLNYSLEGSG